jgi:hypothetical protein
MRLLHPHEEPSLCDCRDARCQCSDREAVVVNSKGIFLCGCCAADCPDVHPEEG